jgi:polysaccharide deacetylase 2 family uncharacterized protein YibQ
MSKKSPKLTRRDFLLKTGAVTAGAVFSSNFFAHALPEKSPIINNPKIAIILDDVGYNMSYIRPFLELKVPITFSILPHIHYSRRLAKRINDEGHQIMLHQPMEPHNSLLNPGPGTLYLNQNIEELHETVEKNIMSFPFAVGVNNHMGSLFTESRQKVLETLKVFKAKEFFFIDSVTSRNSHAFVTAENLNMKTASRNIFIDNQNNKTSICRQLAKLKKHALKFGSAIGIAHPRPETACAMAEFFYSGEASNLSVEYISGILDIS